jgi:hypothetical protein
MTSSADLIFADSNQGDSEAHYPPYKRAKHLCSISVSIESRVLSEYPFVIHEKM